MRHDEWEISIFMYKKLWFSEDVLTLTLKLQSCKALDSAKLETVSSQKITWVAKYCKAKIGHKVLFIQTD